MFNSVLHTCNGWSFRSFSDSFNHPINSDHKNITKSVHQEVLDCFSPKIGRQRIFLADNGYFFEVSRGKLRIIVRIIEFGLNSVTYIQW